MKLIILPNEVSEAIKNTLDTALEGLIISVDEYDQHFHTLLNYFDQHGVIPQISFKKSSETNK